MLETAGLHSPKQMLGLGGKKGYKQASYCTARRPIAINGS